MRSIAGAIIIFTGSLSLITERILMKLPVPPHPDAFMHTTFYGSIGLALIVFGGAVVIRDFKHPDK